MKQYAHDYSYEMKLFRRTRITRNVIAFLCIYILVNMVLHIGVFSIFVRSNSMGTSIPKNTAVFVSPVVKEIDRGDVVFIKQRERTLLSKAQQWFRSTILFLTLQELDPFAVSTYVTDKPCLRRVVAIEGDTVYIRNHMAYVKPAGKSGFLTEFELSPSLYTIDTTLPDGSKSFADLGASPDMDEVTLGPGEYFVLADRRADSVDSRMWGVVRSEMIGGKAIFSYFPFKRFGRL